MAVTNICNTCRWWERTRIANRGRCHRFPNTLETTASDWCGEHVSKAKHDGLRDLAEEVAATKEPKKEKKNVGTV